METLSEEKENLLIESEIHTIISDRLRRSDGNNWWRLPEESSMCAVHRLSILKPEHNKFTAITECNCESHDRTESKFEEFSGDYYDLMIFVTNFVTKHFDYFFPPTEEEEDHDQVEICEKCNLPTGSSGSPDEYPWCCGQCQEDGIQIGHSFCVPLCDCEKGE